MEMRLLFLFAVFTQWQCTHSLTASVSGYTSQSRKLFHKKFPVPAAKRAMIELDVSFQGLTIIPLIMGIDTTEDNVDIRRGCIRSQYGQLGNRNLYTTFSTNRDLSGSLRCDGTGRLRCTGVISVQDYIPRNFSFSFGLPCDSMNKNGYWAVDLKYRMAIHVTNQTTCYKLPADHTCYRYMQFGAYPNLLGEAQIFT